MKHNIFYSWQSDLPNASNRAFIERALIGAAKSISADNSLEIEPVIDRDVQGMTGSPDIAKAIFSKIENAAVFVADVSIINSGKDGRQTPNPNVLIELGYAMKVLGPDRVVLVMNTLFGGPEQLPFDLKMRLAMTYEMSADGERAAERNSLEKKLEAQLRDVFAGLTTPSITKETDAEKLKNLLTDSQGYIRLDELIESQLSKCTEAVGLDHFPVSAPLPDKDTIPARLADYDRVVFELQSTVAILAKYARKDQFRLLQKVFVDLAEVDKDPVGTTYNYWTYLAWYPIIRLAYIAGIAAISAGRYDVIASMFKMTIRNPREEGKERSLMITAITSVFSAWDAFKLLPGLENKRVPISEYLFISLESVVGQGLKLGKNYERLFDRFEVLQFLACGFLEKRFGSAWGPIGRFSWKHQIWQSPFTALVSEAANKKADWEPFKAGMFKGSLEEFNATVTELQPLLDRSAISR